MTVTTPPAVAAPGAGDARLVDLLDAELAFEVATVDGLSSHLPMVLVALDALGADAPRLREAFERDRPGLVPLRPPPSQLHAADWADRLGTGDRYADLRGHFDRAITHRGWSRTLREHAPVLVESAPAAAFHGIIRLAYAIEAGHPGQIAGGLAYWADVWRPLTPRQPSVEGPVTTRSATAVLDALRGEPSLRDPDRAQLVTRRMEGVVARPAFTAHVRPAVVDLDTSAALAVRLFAATDDFVALHAVTGTYAARVVGWHLDAATRARLEWRVFEGIAAAYVAIGAPTLPTDDELGAMRAAPLPDWSAIEAAAVASHDEHVAKLTYTARAEHARTDDELYRYAAARHTGRW
jgi:hypothetical protein